MKNKFLSIKEISLIFDKDEQFIRNLLNRLTKKLKTKNIDIKKKKIKQQVFYEDTILPYVKNYFRLSLDEKDKSKLKVKLNNVCLNKIEGLDYFVKAYINKINDYSYLFSEDELRRINEIKMRKEKDYITCYIFCEE